MIQALGLILFLNGALAWSLNGKYCLPDDVTGLHNCPPGQVCIQHVAGFPWSNYGCCCPDEYHRCVYDWYNGPTGECKKVTIDRYRIDRYFLEISHIQEAWRKCTSDADCANLDPTKQYSCQPQFPFPKPVPGRKKRSLEAQRYIPDLYCLEEPRWKPTTTHPPFSPPTIYYCTDEDHCRAGEKCASSGKPEYGLCKQELDPTGKYCTRTLDCDWYKMETCDDQKGECVNRWERMKQ